MTIKYGFANGSWKPICERSCDCGNKEGLEWICEICARSFDIEVDLLAHQFNSNCEKDLEERHSRYYTGRPKASS